MFCVISVGLVQFVAALNSTLLVCISKNMCLPVSNEDIYRVYLYEYECDSVSFLISLLNCSIVVTSYYRIAVSVDVL